MPISVKAVASGDGWDVTIQNNSDKPAKSVQLVINGQVVSFGGLPAGNRKSMAVKTNNGMDLQKFVYK